MPAQIPEPFFIGQCVQRACVLEVSARKAGNVHPGRDFADLRFNDFLASAAALAPILDQATTRSVGQTVLQAIEATRSRVSSNTNLGIVLLLTPLAAVPPGCSLRAGIGAILGALDVEDARHVFRAVRLANPGGLGKVAAENIAEDPTLPLGQIMALAAHRDLVARQYGNDFLDVFEVGVPSLLAGAQRLGNWEDAIIFTQLNFLARFPDSLIQRKRGAEEARLAGTLAQEVLDSGWPDSPSGRAAFAALDGWLTALGNARNPGTSADLVTASLFAVLREHLLREEDVPWVGTLPGAWLNP